MEILDRFIKGQNPHSGIDFKHPGNKPNSTNKLDLKWQGTFGASAPSNPSKHYRQICATKYSSYP